MLSPMLILASLAVVVSADSSANYTSQYTVDPGSVDITTKNSWCTAQQNSCLDICRDRRAYPNSCVADTLEWSCVCSVGTTPNISSYEQTVPYFECQQWQADCQNPSNSASVQLACEAVVCAVNNPATMSNYYATAAATGSSSTSTASSSSASATTTSTSASGSMAGSMTSSAAAQSSTGAADGALAWSKAYGTGAIGVGVLAMFGLAL